MNLQDVPQEILNNIFAYIEPVKLHKIGLSMPAEIGSYIIRAVRYDLYWKNIVETLLESYLPDDVNRNWFGVYEDLFMLNTNATNSRLLNVLISAAKYGYLDVATVILAKYPNNDYTNFGYRECLTAAASYTHIEQACDRAGKALAVQPQACLRLVKLFLSDHTSVSLTKHSMFGRFALIGAAARGNIDIVKLLLEDKRIQQGDSEALYLATLGNHIDIVRLLLDDSEPQRGDWIRNTEPYNLKKSLIYASKHGYSNIVMMLLEDGRVDPILKRRILLENAQSGGNPNILSL